MNFIVPETKEVSKFLPDYTDVQYHGKGGFKAVYTGINSKNIKEAVKEIYIPKISDGF